MDRRQRMQWVAGWTALWWVVGCGPGSAEEDAATPRHDGGTARAVSASLSGSLPNGATGVAPGTSLTLTPSSDGAVCLRRSEPATEWGTTLFDSALVAPIDAADAVSVTLAAPDTTYRFALRCYGELGASDEPTWTVTTGSGSSMGPSCASIGPPPGFTRSSIDDFGEIIGSSSGVPMGPFPRTNADFGSLFLEKTQYISIAFTVPTDLAPFELLARRFFWNTVNTVPGGYINIFNYYVTLSECPGDFRIPPPGNAPASDPTFATGCRTTRADGTPFTRLNWSETLEVSDESTCALRPGGTYYFNVILDGPSDGVIDLAGTANGCQQATSTGCGFGLRYD